MPQYLKFVLLIFLYYLVIAALFFSCSTTNDINTDNYFLLEPSQEQVLMRNQVGYNLSLLYTNIEKEYPFCLHGRKMDGMFFIDSVTFPALISHTDTTNTYGVRRTEDGFSNETCSKRGDYLGLIHNHRFPFCKPSKVDMEAFNESQSATIDVIACTRNNEILFYATKK